MRVAPANVEQRWVCESKKRKEIKKQKKKKEATKADKIYDNHWIS